MERKKHALQCIDLKKGSGLELGPLYSPVVEKSEAKIFYIDHMSRADLIKKYTGHPFDVESIVEVDYVADGTPLKKLVSNKKFDYVIASHVIEHIPDVVSWLKEVAEVLNEGGILSLVIPDKRFSFDIARDVTKPSQIVGAYVDKLDMSTAAMIYESISEYRELTPMQAWEQGNSYSVGEPADHNLKEAFDKAKLSRDKSHYVDAHCHVFTPLSFFEILKRLNYHGLLDFEVAYFKDTNQNELEFYVSLKKTKNTKKINASIPVVDSPETIVSLTKKNTKLQKKIEILEETLHALQTSTSWKVTKPLRKTKDILKKN